MADEVEKMLRDELLPKDSCFANLRKTRRIRELRAGCC
jgi:hypothetical protein